jgi:hypothetical protein
MTVVSGANEDGVIWLKCPRCKGILPHMEETSPEEGEASVDSKASPAADEIDISRSQPYVPTRTYEVDDVIHHRGWDDYGVVIAKEELPGNRRIIKVRFVEQGEIQLIEGASE